MMLDEHAAFRRFLLSWKTPDYIKGSSRFGVTPWCHPEFREANTQYQASLSEAGDLIKAMADVDKRALWRGTAQDFLNALSPRLRLNGWDNVKLGKGLMKIHDKRPDLVDPKLRNGTSWY